MNEKTRLWLSHIALFLVALIYAANFTIAKQVMPIYLQPYAFIVLRVGAAIVLFWLSWLLWVRERVRREDIGRMFICGLTGVAFNQLLFFKGLSLTTPIHGALIMLTTPILVLIMSGLWLKDKITPRKWIGVLLGLSGATWLILSRTTHNAAYAPNPALGDLYVGINAASYAVYLILIKPLMIRYHPITMMAWTFLFGAVVVFPVGWSELQTTDFYTFPASAWWAIAFVLFFVTFMTYLLNAAAMRVVSPSVASAYIYLQPLLTSLIAVSTGKDSLTAPVLIAGALIGSGVYLASSVGSRNKT